MRFGETLGVEEAKTIIREMRKLGDETATIGQHLYSLGFTQVTVSKAMNDVLREERGEKPFSYWRDSTLPYYIGGGVLALIAGIVGVVVWKRRGS